MLSVTYFYREPRKTGYSIEGIFNLVKDCLKNKIELKEFYCDNKLSRFQNTIRARKFANQINHITGDVNFLAIGLKGNKNILTIHDMGHYDTLRHRRLAHLMYRLFWFKFPLKHIDIITVISEFSKKKFIEYTHFPEDRIRIIHNPIKPIFKFVEKNGIDKQPKILMLGSGKHKNLNNLIEAAKDTHFHLDIVGFPSAAEIEKLTTYNISYTLYNKLTDEEVNERYIACDILYIASFYEGFGMPIIEAQAIGRPVITSNYGAMKEIAKDTALLVDPHKPKEIRNAIMQLMADKTYYCKMVALGRANTTAYQYEVIAQQYLDVYNELANLKK